MAYSCKISNQNHKVVCLLSDGELDEGSNWEATLLASHLKLDNLIVIVDKTIYRVSNQPLRHWT